MCIRNVGLFHPAARASFQAKFISQSMISKKKRYVYRGFTNTGPIKVGVLQAHHAYFIGLEHVACKKTLFL